MSEEEVQSMILVLKKQGLSNNQIINFLQIQGTDYSKIYKGFYEIDLTQKIPVPDAEDINKIYECENELIEEHESQEAEFEE
ncbi:hypothetical protein HN587_05390 [Candidatus Woesearchaeota archaeon]|nr:hypothetical protein [Candidatus Woesearchaeota archaeon]